MRMNYGPERRKQILDLLSNNCYIIVNAKYQWNDILDKDLKYLKKKGYIKRGPTSGAYTSATKATLILAEK